MATQERYEYMPPHGTYQPRSTIAERYSEGFARHAAENVVRMFYRRARRRGETHREAVLRGSREWKLTMPEMERILAEPDSPAPSTPSPWAADGMRRDGDRRRQ